MTQSLRQFAYGLGHDYMPGEILFAPYEEDITDSRRETVRVTTKPHNGNEIEVPKNRVAATNFAVEEQPLLHQLMPVARPTMAVPTGTLAV